MIRSPYPEALQIFIGSDDREAAAFDVALDSLYAHTRCPLMVTEIYAPALELLGLLRRPVTRISKGRGLVIRDGRVERRTVAAAGMLWDDISGAPMSTQFANARFLAFILGQQRWSVFMDPDVVVLADILELFKHADDRYAVMVAQHGALEHYGRKMDGQVQLPYFRKNWSSVMLINGSHPANFGLTLERINTMSGKDLHRFAWLRDDEIGRLPPEWNWLVGVQPKPATPKLAHYTLGGPWLPGWSAHEHDDLWLRAATDLRARPRTDHARGSEERLQG